LEVAVKFAAQVPSPEVFCVPAEIKTKLPSPFIVSGDPYHFRMIYKVRTKSQDSTLTSKHYQQRCKAWNREEILHHNFSVTGH